MIPKTIHYCWFGGKPLPPPAEKCLASWGKYLGGYEIRKWDESNFDLSISPYTREAYDAKKFAFVTDYVRLWALYNHGGIYMDTDVEIIKPLDDFLKYPAFTGFEGDFDIPTGIMGSEKHGKWAKEQLDLYTDRHFILPGGRLDLTPNVTTISRSMAKRGFILKNSRQNFENIIEVFPKDYFAPRSYRSTKLEMTENTHAIHHFAGSWLTPAQRLKRAAYPLMNKLRIFDLLNYLRRNKI